MYKSPYEEWGYSRHGYWEPSQEEMEYWISFEESEDEEDKVAETTAADKKNEIVTKREFYIDLLQGRIAQVIIESILRKFSYEVFPYGYESYLTSIIKELSKPNTDEMVEKIRSSPDLIIYEPEHRRAFLLEIKSFGGSGNKYSIRKEVYDKYLHHWPNALLTILSTKSKEIYVQSFESIDISADKIINYKGKQLIQLELGKDLHEFQNYFNLNKDLYTKYISSIQHMMDSKYL